MSNQSAVKKVYEGSMAGRRCRDRPRLRWTDDKEKDLRSMGGGTREHWIGENGLL
jgi:hypothetical protein